VAGLVGVDGVVPGGRQLLTPQQWAAFGDEVRIPSPIPGYAMETYARHTASTQLAGSLPGGRAIIVPGTTHYVQSQRPDVVIATVRSVTS
jgi:D-lyxose ketol-isomerase